MAILTALGAGSIQSHRAGGSRRRNLGGEATCSQKLLANQFFVQVPPIWVRTLNESYFLVPGKPFDLFLTKQCALVIVSRLPIHESARLVPLCKTVHKPLFVLPYPSQEIVSLSSIQDAVMEIGGDVHKAQTFFHATMLVLWLSAILLGHWPRALGWGHSEPLRRRRKASESAEGVSARCRREERTDVAICRGVLHVRAALLGSFRASIFAAPILPRHPV